MSIWLKSINVLFISVLFAVLLHFIFTCLLIFLWQIFSLLCLYINGQIKRVLSNGSFDNFRHRQKFLKGQILKKTFWVPTEIDLTFWWVEGELNFFYRSDSKAFILMWFDRFTLLQFHMVLGSILSVLMSLLINLKLEVRYCLKSHFVAQTDLRSNPPSYQQLRHKIKLKLGLKKQNEKSSTNFRKYNVIVSWN